MKQVVNNSNTRTATAKPKKCVHAVSREQLQSASDSYVDTTLCTPGFDSYTVLAMVQQVVVALRTWSRCGT